jgi:hypothetical protein
MFSTVFFPSIFHLRLVKSMDTWLGAMTGVLVLILCYLCDLGKVLTRGQLRFLVYAWVITEP